MPSRLTRSLAVFASAALPLLTSCLLTGCAMNSTATGGSLTDAGTLHLQGSIHGGQQPLGHSLIQLYQVGTGTVAGSAGYTANAVPLLGTAVYSSTDGTGSFSITGQYSCASGAQVYLTASGGSIDNTTTNSNPNIAMMAALGSCSSLLANASTSFVSINEVSTVASAYALAQFGARSSFGTALSSTPTGTPADNFATSSSNATGLANAMATAQVLANFYSTTTFPTGYAPGLNTNGSAQSEYWTIDTVANILAACINSGVTALATAGDGTACGTLYLYTTPTGKTAPRDTIQSTLYMALYPGDANLLSGTNPGQNLANLIPATPPFQPYVYPDGVNNFINDWTIAINYQPVATGTTAKLIAQPYDLAIDSVGNVWINNINFSTATPANSYILEVDPTGNPVFAGVTACRAAPCALSDYQISAFRKQGGAGRIAFGIQPGGGSPNNLAIDPANNVWYADRKNGYLIFNGGSGSGSVSNGGSYNIASATSLGTGYPTATTTISAVGVRVDGNSQPWFTVNVGTQSNAACTNSVTTGGSTVGTVTGFSAARTGSGTTGSPYLYGATGTLAYGGTGGTAASTLTLDAGNPSCTAGSTTSLCNPDFYDRIAASNTSANALPGAPFFWTVANTGIGGTAPNAQAASTLGMYSTGLGVKANGTTANTVVGCESPLAQIGTANASVTPQTTVNAINPTGSNQVEFAIKARNLTFGPGGKAWLLNNGFVDASSTTTNVLESINLGYPNYGSAFTSAGFTAAQSSPAFSLYTGGGLSSTFNPQGMALDGNGSPWIFGYANPLTSPAPVIHLSATGAALSPSTGFTGATYSNGTTTLARSTGGQAYGTGAIDPSGNVWVPNGSGTSTSIYEIVGSAAPVVTPLSLGIKNGTLGMMP